MRKYHRHYEAKHGATKPKARKANAKGRALPSRDAVYAALDQRKKNPDSPSTAAENLLRMFPMPNPRVRNQSGLAEAIEETGLSKEDVQWQSLVQSTGLSNDPKAAFNFGVRFGMMTGIELCDLNPFSRRSQIRREVYERLQRSFSDEQRAFAQQLVTGIEKGVATDVRFTQVARGTRGV